jgi:CO/xanthine dehydrogenase Mo-binding subunit
MTATRFALLDLPEGNDMRAPGEAPGMMELEIAMDEMAGNSSTADVYAAFADGQVRAGSRSVPLAQAAGARGLVGEDVMEYADLAEKYQQSTFGAHFVEIGVDAATGRDSRETHDGGLCRWPHSQPEIGARPSHRSDDYECWCSARGGTCGRQAARLFRQS